MVTKSKKMDGISHCHCVLLVCGISDAAFDFQMEL